MAEDGFAGGSGPQEISGFFCASIGDNLKQMALQKHFYY
jgi:hypothetical protein